MPRRKGRKPKNIDWPPADKICPHCFADLMKEKPKSYRLFFRKCIYCRGEVSNGLNKDNTGNGHY